MFKFLTHRPFWANLLVAIIIAMALLFALFYSLGIITRHNSTTKVPILKGLTVEKATKLLEQQNLTVEVIDSVYIDTLPPLAVIRQSPDEGSLVKTNRTVYLTINRATPPSIEMPNLIGYSFIAAQMYLKSMGLKIGDTTYKPDIAQNTVLQQMRHDVDIQPGSKILVGTKIDLVLGSGVGDEEFKVPDLIGLTYEEAKMVLELNDLNIGAVIIDPDVKDTTSAFIYRQNPPKYAEATEPGMERIPNHIRSGQLMDIWLSVKKINLIKDTIPVKTVEQ